MTPVTSITITIPNPTAGQMLALNDIMSATHETTPKKRGTKNTAPQKTVSEEEEESFGAKALDEEDLDDRDQTDTDSDDEDEGESSVTFDQVKAAIDKYGEKKPNDMTAILKACGVSSTKELKANKNRWEHVYRKTLAKLKLLKKMDR